MSTGVLKKPQLRGGLGSSLKVHAVACFAISIGAAMIWKFGFADRRKRRYNEYYQTYDDTASFERMKRAGVFRSVNPDGTPGEKP